MRAPPISAMTAYPALPVVLGGGSHCKNRDVHEGGYREQCKFHKPNYGSALPPNFSPGTLNRASVRQKRSYNDQ